MHGHILTCVVLENWRTGYAGLCNNLKNTIDGDKTSLNESLDMAASGDNQVQDQEQRKLIVLAIDCYDSHGAPEKKMISLIQMISKAIKLDAQFGRQSGVALSTAMPMSEFLKSGNIKLDDFGALICSSGSKVYYPGTYADEGGKHCPDPDYSTHTEYRWGPDGLKKTIWKLINMAEGLKSSHSSGVIEHDVKSSNSHCRT
ncbi:hypothetical protein SASPL_150205 [Salvia splendens]|uniref:Uncharacterized protein n=1 Tax=Salvia splendens TaxID=180675 RepID=A0A8X8W5L5_SALSN|nr:hypothetical protein SASPL_150205 [Salvia splendens]